MLFVLTGCAHDHCVATRSHDVYQYYRCSYGGGDYSSNASCSRLVTMTECIQRECDRGYYRDADGYCSPVSDRESSSKSRSGGNSNAQMTDADYNNRGNSYYEKGQYDQAISDYSEAIKINPADAIAYNNRGLAYYKKGQYDKAISDCTKAIGINPAYAAAYHIRGVAHDEKGQYDQAMSDYSEAIKINPADAIAYDFRGYLYWEILGKKEKACKDFKKACTLGRCGNYNLCKGKK